MGHMDIPCFFYGSYMDPDVLRRFGADPGEARPATLDGWRLTFTPHANIIPGEGTVHGFMMPLSHDDLERLYGPQGYVTTYRPVPVAVDADGHAVAMTYVEEADEQAPEGNYLESFIAIATRLGLPASYVQAVRAQAESLVRGTLA